MIFGRYSMSWLVGGAVVAGVLGVGGLFGLWSGLWRAALVFAAVFAFLAALFTNAAYARRFVDPATPGQLGIIRVVVGGTLLISILWEDFASSALLPREMLRPQFLGAFQFLYELPLGLDRFMADYGALRVAEEVTTLLLVLATIGWATRVSVPLAATGYLLLGGINRQYCWFYHTGLVPALVLLVMAFMPCGDGLSLDRFLRERRGQRVAPAQSPSLRYGWARYTCWAVIALLYAAAGLSKIRNGGWGWWHPVNIKSILLRDTLNPMAFDWGVSLHLVQAPDVLFALIGLATILGEVSFMLLLFSRWARLVLPGVTILMHLGIWVLQNVLFFDLMLLLLVFYEPRDVRVTLYRGRGTMPQARPREIANAPTERRGPLGVALLAALLIVVWLHRKEYYPLTAMQMYSQRVVLGELNGKYYYRVYAIRASGARTRAPLEHAIRAMADSRYRRVIGDCFVAERVGVCRAYLQAAAGAYNAKVGPGKRIRAFEVEQWTWNFLEQPTDPDHGDLVARLEVLVD